MEQLKVNEDMVSLTSMCGGFAREFVHRAAANRPPT